MRSTACLPPVYDWKSLERQYKEMKSLMTMKYGKPRRSVERFRHRVPYGDNLHYGNAVKSGECDYRSEYEVEGGQIDLAIHNFSDPLRPFLVMVRYVDRENLLDKCSCMRGIG